MQVIKGRDFASSLGEATGKGLSNAFSRLAESKYKQLAERHQIKKFTDTGAFDEQTAAFINALPEKNRWEAARALAQQQRPQQTPEQFAQSGIPEQQAGMQEFMQQRQPNNQAISQALQQQRQEYPAQTQQPSQQRSFAERLQGSGGPQATRNQALIDKQNANYLKGQTKGSEVAQQTEEILNQMEDLLNTGKVASGVKGRFSPEWLQSDETQLFDKYSNTLAGLLSQQYGTPTGMKIKFSQSQKPNISQNAGTQRELIKRLRQEVQRPLMMNEIKEQLIAENGYQQPSNLESRVNQIYNQQRKNPEGMRTREEMKNTREQRLSQAPQDESIVGTGIRGVARSAARAGEAVAGSLGDIAAAGLGIGNYLTSGAIPDYGTVQGYLPLSAPTSDQIKSTLSNITKGYTDPQSGTEETMDNIVSTVAAIFGPGKAKGLLGKGLSKVVAPKTAEIASKVLLPLSGSTPLKRAIGMGIAGEAGAGLAEVAGLGTVGQAATKFAFATAAGIPGTGQALKDLMKANYTAAEQGFAGKTVNANDLRKDLFKMATNVEHRAIPNKEILKEIIGEAENALGSVTKSGQVEVNDLLRLKKDLNTWYGLAQEQRVQGQKHLPKEIRPFVHELLEKIKKPLAEAAQKYPDPAKAQAIGDDIYRGFNQLSDMTKSLQKFTSLTKGFKDPVKAAFLVGPAYFAGLTGAKATIAGGVAAKGIAEALKLKDLIKNSATAQRHYMEALKAAASNNRQLFAQHAAKLNDEFTQYENH